MRHTTTLFLYISLILSFHVSSAQWIKANGPFGADIYKIANMHGKLFAGTETGVFVSGDGGNTWDERSNGLPQFPYINSFSCDSDGNVFTGSPYFGLYMSNDDGGFWQQIGVDVFDKVFSIATAGHRLIAASNLGIYVTENFNSWLLVYQGPGFNNLVFHSDSFFCTSGFGIVRSLDSGMHWNLITSTVYTKLSLVNDTLYAVYNQKIYRSTTGTGWVLVTSITDQSLPQSIAGKNENLYIATNDSGVYVSHDYGITFHRATNGIDVVGTRFALVVGTKPYIASGGAGVWSSDDFGEHWYKLNTGLTNCGPVTCLKKFGDDIFVSCSAGIFYTHDHGNSWIEIDSGLPEKSAAAIAVKDSTIFAGTYSHRMYKSIDYGKTWIESSTGLGSQYDVQNIEITDDGLIYCTLGSNGVFVSYDNGDNWQATNLTGTIFKMGTYGNKVFGCTVTQIWATVDSGQTWTASSTGVTTKNFKSFQQYDSLIYITSDKIYYSSNAGANWYSLNAPYEGYVGFWRLDSIMYALGYYNVYYGDASGTNWNNIDQNLSLPIFGDQIYAEDSDAFLGREDGIWIQHGFDFPCLPGLIVDVSDTTLCLGQTASLIFIDSCTGLVATNLSWSPSINTTPTDSGFNAYPTQTTLYKVTSISGSLKDSAFMLINVDNDCVWPGDYNRDGIVNNEDVLVLGVLNLFEGSHRTGSYGWTESYSDDWFGNLHDSLNYKHADGSGNGEITFGDTGTVKTNYLKTHTPACSPVFISNPTTNIQLNFPGNTLYTDSIYSIPVTLGSDTSLAYSIYGTAFTINFDSVYFDKDTMTFDFSDSWLGEPDSLLRFKKLRYSSGALDVTESRFHHQNITGEGVIGYFTFKVDSLAPAGPCTFSITNPALVDAEYNFIHINSPPPAIINIIPSDATCWASFYLVPDTTLLHHYWAINLANGNGSPSYTWSWGDGTYDSIAYPSHIYADSGFYTICLTIHDSTGCSDSICIDYNIQKLSRENSIVKIDVVDSIPSIPTNIQSSKVLQSWSVFPNPASANAYINYSLSASASVSLEVIDVLGNKLRGIVNENEDAGQHHSTIPLQKLSNGIYVLQIRAGDQVESQKLIVLK